MRTAWDARFIDGPARGIGMAVPAESDGLPPFVIYLPPVTEVLGRMMTILRTEPDEKTTTYKLVGTDRDERVARYSIGTGVL